MKTVLILLFVGLLLPVARPLAQDAAGSTNQYLQFIRKEAAALRQADSDPSMAQDWVHRKIALRDNLLTAWGGFPPESAPLDAQIIGEFAREGYRVQKLIFQTLPGLWMTANAYLPANATGRTAALLMVHGHWQGAKQDPVVQARCIGAVKLGFFVLAVDAFGAGERGVNRALGEYHGEMTAATLLPAGRPLSGIQVYENMRAVDYLRTRPEVDPSRIGITGASGGGNQTMYASAWDERFEAAAPVCSVGNYQAYLGAACCLCEVVPGALRFTEEGDVLGLVAPRALMVINATRDAPQFSVEAAEKSLRTAGATFELLNHRESLRHVVFDSGHDYSQPMREAVYGWMALHLKAQGDGAPIAEPVVAPEDPETLREFPGDSRPDDWMTIPKFAAAEGERAIAGVSKAQDAIRSQNDWLREAQRRRAVLQKLIGGFPPRTGLGLQVEPLPDGRRLTFFSEPGITLSARQRGAPNGPRVAIALDLDGATNALNRAEVKKAGGEGWSVVTLDLRATGGLSWPSDKVGRAPDHTTAEWGLWIGRPLLGQWIWDVRRLVDAVTAANGVAPEEVAVMGFGPGGLVALAAAALDDRISRVTVYRTLATFISDTPYEGQRLGTMVPGILPAFGDVPELAALVAPRPLTLFGPVSGSGAPLSSSASNLAFARTRRAYELSSAAGRFQIPFGALRIGAGK